MLAHGYRIKVEFNDGTETAVYEYKSERVADSVVRHYKKQPFTKKVYKEEF